MILSITIILIFVLLGTVNFICHERTKREALENAKENAKRMQEHEDAELAFQKYMGEAYKASLPPTIDKLLGVKHE